NIANTVVYDYTQQSDTSRSVLIGRRTLSLVQPSDHSISGLDPASYSQHEDDEGRHVTWCPDPRCYPRARFGPESRQLVGPDEMLRMLDKKPWKFCGWNALDGRRFF